MGTEGCPTAYGQGAAMQVDGKKSTQNRIDISAYLIYETRKSPITESPNVVRQARSFVAREWMSR